jgi:hypothetical protein
MREVQVLKEAGERAVRERARYTGAPNENRAMPERRTHSKLASARRPVADPGS